MVCTHSKFSGKFVIFRTVQFPKIIFSNECYENSRLSIVQFRHNDESTRKYHTQIIIHKYRHATSFFKVHAMNFDAIKLLYYVATRCFQFIFMNWKNSVRVYTIQTLETRGQANSFSVSEQHIIYVVHRVYKYTIQYPFCT